MRRVDEWAYVWLVPDDQLVAWRIDTTKTARFQAVARDWDAVFVGHLFAPHTGRAGAYYGKRLCADMCVRGLAEFSSRVVPR